MDNPFDLHDKESATSGAFLLPTDSEILEGFLCPVCKRDLRTPERLTVHVEHEHSEEQDLLKSLKEIFSLARQGILKGGKRKPAGQQGQQQQGAEGSEPSPPSRYGAESGVVVGSAGTANNPLLQPGGQQPAGCTCEHMAYFRAVRSPRLERYAAETNKLIIRLDKLLDGLPADPDGRKRHEQSKVPWIDGKLVKLCPTCARGFGLTRRQHHCRVCGSVMCDGCSRFLTLEEAGRLVNPTVASPAGSAPAAEPDQPNESSHFRVCEHCMRLLLVRMEMQDWRRERPLLRQYYEALERERTDIEPHIGMYRRILDSLYEGDVIYRLSDASALRERIGRSAEKLDGVSKSLQTLPTAPGSREEALKKAIRLGCIAYIKERMLSIPPLPVEDEIKRIQARKRTETERRLERERQLALEAFERLELQAGGGAEPGTDRQNGSSSSSSTASTAEMTNGRYGAAVSTMDNWSGTQAHGTGGTSDPLIDQINIVKGYIRQARAALRFEEVATLERNLSELTQEFYHRQRQDTDTKQPETS